ASTIRRMWQTSLRMICAMRWIRCSPANQSARRAARRLVAQLSELLKMILRVILTIIVVSAICAGAFMSPAQSNRASAAAGEDIRQIDLDGLKKLLQRDPKDTRPLLVNFWATWCD